MEDCVTERYERWYQQELGNIEVYFHNYHSISIRPRDCKDSKNNVIDSKYRAGLA